jgi:hypothetical protein
MLLFFQNNVESIPLHNTYWKDYDDPNVSWFLFYDFWEIVILTEVLGLLLMFYKLR